MSARILINGRAAWASRDWPRKPAPLPLEHDKTAHVPPDSTASPFRMGTAVEDPDDGVTYRVVRPGVLDPSQGWAPVDFWMRRWKCAAVTIRDLAAHGLLDAAIEHGSVVRRFRVRNEPKVLDWLKERNAKPKAGTVRVKKST